MKFEEKQNQEVDKKQAPVYINFETKEEAEEAWLNMLRNVGIEPDWTWEQCIRKASANPIYRALKTTLERKEAFQRYCRETKEERLVLCILFKELKKKRLEDDEQALEELFRATSELTGSTRLNTAEHLFADNPVWTTALPANRKNFFYKYIDKLIISEKTNAREIRKANLEKLRKLFNNCNIDHAISWKEAQEKFKANILFASDPNLSKMDPMDILISFEDHVLALDSKFRQARTNRLRTDRRRERMVRDGYRALLKEKLRSGMLNLKSKWKEIYPEIADDERYIYMLGNPGSSPLDMFWDLQMLMEDKFKFDKRVMYDIMKRADYYIEDITTFNQFYSKFQRDLDTLDQSNVKIFFGEQHGRALKEEKRHQEKKIKKRIDALRSIMKRIDPPIKIDDTFESVIPRLEEKSEFNKLSSQEQQIAFDKFIGRLKDKLDRKDEHRDRDKKRRRHRSHSRSSESDHKRSGSDSDHGHRSKKEKSRKTAVESEEEGELRG